MLLIDRVGVVVDETTLIITDVFFLEDASGGSGGGGDSGGEKKERLMLGDKILSINSKQLADFENSDHDDMERVKVVVSRGLDANILTVWTKMLSESEMAVCKLKKWILRENNWDDVREWLEEQFDFKHKSGDPNKLKQWESELSDRERQVDHLHEHLDQNVKNLQKRRKEMDDKIVEMEEKERIWVEEHKRLQQQLEDAQDKISELKEFTDVLQVALAACQEEKMALMSGDDEDGKGMPTSTIVPSQQQQRVYELEDQIEALKLSLDLAMRENQQLLLKKNVHNSNHNNDNNNNNNDVNNDEECVKSMAILQKMVKTMALDAGVAIKAAQNMKKDWGMLSTERKEILGELEYARGRMMDLAKQRDKMHGEKEKLEQKMALITSLVPPPPPPLSSPSSPSPSSPSPSSPLSPLSTPQKPSLAEEDQRATTTTSTQTLEEFNHPRDDTIAVHEKLLAEVNTNFALLEEKNTELMTLLTEREAWVDTLTKDLERERSKNVEEFTIIRDKIRASIIAEMDEVEVRNNATKIEELEREIQRLSLALLEVTSQNAADNGARVIQFSDDEELRRIKEENGNLIERIEKAMEILSIVINSFALLHVRLEDAERQSQEEKFPTPRSPSTPVSVALIEAALDEKIADLTDIVHYRDLKIEELEQTVEMLKQAEFERERRYQASKKIQPRAEVWKLREIIKQQNQEISAFKAEREQQEAACIQAKKKIAQAKFETKKIEHELNSCL